MNGKNTVAELETLLGENVKNLRLQGNIGQIELARGTTRRQCATSTKGTHGQQKT